MNFLPSRVTRKCENLEILELEYIRMVDASTSDTTMTSDKPNELPIEFSSQARVSQKSCKRDYCDGPSNIPADYHMAAQCTGSLGCPNHRNLPSCWYMMGTTSVSYQYYYHYVNTEMSCLPCCQFTSNEAKMPGF